jgi:EpsI family protein
MNRTLFLTACAILLMQASAVRMLSISERDLSLPGLHQLPHDFGNFTATGEQALEPAVLEYLRPDEYTLRDYVNASDGRRVNLFVGFFKSLQNTYGPHSPRNCLPSSGWLQRSWKISHVDVPGSSERIPVNEYVLEKAGQNILVLYWYQNDRHVWAEEFRAKLTMLPDLLRYRRSDVSLVRLVIPMNDTTWDHELSTGTEFTRLAFPALVEHFRSVQ